MQALSRSGHTYLSNLSENAFAEMIDEWPHLIQKVA